MKESMHVIVSGLVQGVGFRYFAARHASALGLTGYARNLPSDSVEILAEGEREGLDDFFELLRTGPRSAMVRDCKVTRSTWTGEFPDFSIR